MSVRRRLRQSHMPMGLVFFNTGLNRVKASARDQRGMSLTELMVASAIIGVVALGIATVTGDLFRVQNKANLTSTFNTVRNFLQSTVQNSQAWAYTVAHASNRPSGTEMQCLVSGTACTANTWYTLRLRTADDNDAFDGKTATSGFTPQGTLCNTFNGTAGSGVAGCPIAYTLEWRALCPLGAATCVSPNIEVRGTARFNSSDTVLGGGFNSARYSFIIARGGSSIRNDSILVEYRETDNSGETGNGDCRTGWITRQLNYVRSDPGSNVTNGSGSGSVLSPLNQMTIKAGTYSCRVTAPGFKLGGNRIRLIGGTIDVTSGMVIAQIDGGSSLAIIDTSFTISANTTLTVQQTCSGWPTDDTNGTSCGANCVNWAYGVPVPGPGNDYSIGVTYTVISCVRTS